jgi:endonuclease/exonuclease/phosphatase family metal-dependent hydrolase
VVRALEQTRADVIGLQEVCLDPETGLTHAERLAGHLGYHHAFHPVTLADYGDGAVATGLAVLSRWPVQRWDDVPLPSTPDAEQYAMHALIEAPAAALDLIVVHLTPRGDEAQVAAVTRLLNSMDMLPPGRPAFLVGDFNAPPESVAIRSLTSTRFREDTLHDAWQQAHPSDLGATMPSHAPVVRLDYLFISPGVSVSRADRMGDQPDPDGFYPSDHLGVTATLHLPGLIDNRSEEGANAGVRE